MAVIALSWWRIIVEPCRRFRVPLSLSLPLSDTSLAAPQRYSVMSSFRPGAQAPPKDYVSPKSNRNSSHPRSRCPIYLFSQPDTRSVSHPLARSLLTFSTGTRPGARCSWFHDPFRCRTCRVCRSGLQRQSSRPSTRGPPNVRLWRSARWLRPGCRTRSLAYGYGIRRS
jgi:hypothetical protein